MNNLDKVKELIKNCEYEKAVSIIDGITDGVDKPDYLFEKARILLHIQEYNCLIFDIKQCIEKIKLVSNKYDIQWMIFEILKIIFDYKINNKTKYTEEFILILESNIIYLKLEHKIIMKTKMVEYFCCNFNYLKSFEYTVDLIESIGVNIEYRLIDILNISLRELDYTVVDKKNIIKQLNLINKRNKDIKIKNILLNELEILRNKTYLKSRPVGLHVNLTNKCNLKCIMCHNEHAESYDIDDRLVNFIKNNMPYLYHISWLGGEVFMSDIFNELSCLAIKNNIKQRITTNALLLDEAKIKFIIDNNIDLKISIDAVDKDLYEKIRVGGSFDKLIQNLRVIKEYNNKRYPKKYMYAMAATIMILNYNTIKDIIEFAIEYGFQSIDLQKCRTYAETNHLALNKKQQNEVAVEIEALKKEFKKNGESIEINTDFYINREDFFDINNSMKKGIDVNKKRFCMAPWKLLCIEKNELYFSCVCDRINVSNCMQDDIWNCKDVVELRKKIVKNNLPNCCNVICRNAQDFGEKIRLGMI